MKQLNRSQEAFDVINQALQIKADEPSALYSRACYAASLTHPSEEVLRDLAAAIKLNPSLIESAKREKEFASLAETPEFRRLLG